MLSDLAMSSIKPTMPFQPEPEAQLKARYAAALDPVYDPQEVIAGKVKRPGQQRKHVFDTEDGYRLIISRERLKGAPPVLHISVSLDVSPAALGMDRLTFKPMCLNKVHVIVQAPLQPRHTEFTGKVLHFIFDVPTLPQENVRQQRQANR